MFACLGFGHFILFVYFFLGCEAQKVRLFKNADFSVTYPLKGV